MACARFLGALKLAALCCSVSACSTFVTYSGSELPDSKVAAVNCYSRFYFVYLESCRFQAVDGLRPGLSELFGNSAKIVPGAHWIEIAFEKYFGGGGGVTDVCAFDIELAPGNVYQVKAHSLETELSNLAMHGQRSFYRGTMDLDITGPDGARELRSIGVTCNFSGGSMCRKDEDCERHPDIKCFPQDGFAFGACRFKDADI